MMLSLPMCQFDPRRDGHDIARHLLDGSIGGPGIEDNAAAGTTEYP